MAAAKVKNSRLRRARRYSASHCSEDDGGVAGQCRVADLAENAEVDDAVGAELAAPLREFAAQALDHQRAAHSRVRSGVAGDNRNRLSRHWQNGPAPRRGRSSNPAPRRIERAPVRDVCRSGFCWVTGHESSVSGGFLNLTCRSAAGHRRQQVTHRKSDRQAHHRVLLDLLIRLRQPAHPARKPCAISRARSLLGTH